MYYVATLDPHDDGSGRYDVTFADLPGCVTHSSLPYHLWPAASGCGRFFALGRGVSLCIRACACNCSM